ncbi:MAG TPA: GNAT family N-acetyltransferase [Aggregatilineales bacterium]|nr:GNAT family N-acetyltransferase [Aggregatilineales bacterium]
MIPIKELSSVEAPLLEQHFLALPSEDRRLRFGAVLSDQAVCTYLRNIDYERDALFGVWGDELQIVGAAHLARLDGHAELGVSVLPGHRGLGLGGALLGRAHKHARNWGVRAMFMHCMSENSAIMHLARKQGMDVVTNTGEADAWLKLPPADPTSHMSAVFEQRAALFDYAMKSQLMGVRRFAGAMTSLVE